MLHNPPMHRSGPAVESLSVERRSVPARPVIGPALSLMSEERTIYDSERKRRVRVLGSPDGSYSFIEERFSDEPLEMCWIPQTHRRSQPICSSFEIAMRESCGRIGWLAAAADEG